MADDQNTPLTFRFNILGSLEIERAGERLPISTTKAAEHLLALLAVKERYENQELVDVLWPGDSLDDDRVDVAESVRNRLDRAVTDARAVLGVRANSGVLKRRLGNLYRVRGKRATATTDLDEFDALSKSDQADDWRAALALVRGPIAQLVPTSKMDTGWIDTKRAFQRERITRLLKQLDRDASDETINQRVLEVLDGRWAPPSPATQLPSEPAAAPQAAVETKATPPASLLAPPRRVSSMRSARRLLTTHSLVVGLVVLTAVSVGIVVALSGKSPAIPPPGSVIDAQTGHVVAHPQVRASPFPAQLEFGSIFRACDLSAKTSCGSGHDGPTPLKVSVGDTIALRLTLNDGFSAPIHNLKLIAVAQRRSIKKPHKRLEASPTELEVSMSAKWPETLGTYEVVNEPGIRNHRGTQPAIRPIYLQLPHPGRYSLNYISGSTTLVNKETSFFHYLPDGITRGGISLENVGQPPSCFWCAKQYIRYVYFHLRVESSK